VKITIRSLESIVGGFRDEVGNFYEEKEPPGGYPQAVLTIATVDKKGIATRKAPTEKGGQERHPTSPGRRRWQL
jgi:hypothetical protein